MRHLVDAYHFQGRTSEALDLAVRVSEEDPEDRDIWRKIEVLRGCATERSSEFSDEFTERSIASTCRSGLDRERARAMNREQMHGYYPDASCAHEEAAAMRRSSPAEGAE